MTGTGPRGGVGARSASGWLPAALVAAVFLAGPTLAANVQQEAYAADKGSNTVDVSAYPKKMQGYYKIYSQRCSKCHPLARSINARMPVAKWKRYVRRMANREGSGIPPRDAGRIYLWLKYRENRLSEQTPKAALTRHKQKSAATKSTNQKGPPGASTSPASTGSKTKKTPPGGQKTYAADKGPSTLAVGDYPSKMQAYYKIYSQRCSKCHSLARSINTRMPPEKWRRYVRRMANREGSGIPPKDAKRIYLFLKYRERQLAAGGGTPEASAAGNKETAPPKSGEK